jgi:hypothetical protein
MLQGKPDHRRNLPGGNPPYWPGSRLNIPYSSLKPGKILVTETFGFERVLRCPGNATTGLPGTNVTVAPPE